MTDALHAPFPILFEDGEALVIDKPGGLPLDTPRAGGPSLEVRLDELCLGFQRVPFPVHRLDRDTSGVLLLGKTPNAAARLSGAFARRKAKKIYWAIVVGSPKPPQGVIDLPLVKKGVGDREMVMPADPKDPGGEPAETDYVTVSRASGRATWLALQPYTGRTHQLRAHLRAIGHPILGDPKYGDEASTALSEGLKLQLHARRLIVPHPSAGLLVLEAPLSPEMKAGFDRFGFDEHEAPADPFPGGSRKR